MDLLEFGVKGSGHDYFLAFKTVHKVRSVQPVDTLCRRKNKISAETLNAVHRAGV